MGASPLQLHMVENGSLSLKAKPLAARISQLLVSFKTFAENMDCLCRSWSITSNLSSCCEVCTGSSEARTSVPCVPASCQLWHRACWWLDEPVSPSVDLLLPISGVTPCHFCYCAHRVFVHHKDNCFQGQEPNWRCSFCHIYCPCCQL